MHAIPCTDLNVTCRRDIWSSAQEYVYVKSNSSGSQSPGRQRDAERNCRGSHRDPAAGTWHSMHSTEVQDSVCHRWLDAPKAACWHSRTVTPLRCSDAVRLPAGMWATRPRVQRCADTGMTAIPTCRCGQRLRRRRDHQPASIKMRVHQFADIHPKSYGRRHVTCNLALRSLDKSGLLEIAREGCELHLEIFYNKAIRHLRHKLLVLCRLICLW